MFNGFDVSAFRPRTPTNNNADQQQRRPTTTPTNNNADQQQRRPTTTVSNSDADQQQRCPIATTANSLRLQRRWVVLSLAGVNNGIGYVE